MSKTKNTDQSQDQEVMDQELIDLIAKENEALKAEIAEARAEAAKAIEELKAANSPKEKKANKGTPMTFQNQAGKTIIGLGVPYYVVRMDKTLYYKAADAVTHLKKLPENGETPEPVETPVVEETVA